MPKQAAINITELIILKEGNIKIIQLTVYLIFTKMFYVLYNT